MRALNKAEYELLAGTGDRIGDERLRAPLLERGLIAPADGEWFERTAMGGLAVRVYWAAQRAGVIA